MVGYYPVLYQFLKELEILHFVGVYGSFYLETAFGMFSEIQKLYGSSGSCNIEKFRRSTLKWGKYHTSLNSEIV